MSPENTPPSPRTKNTPLKVLIIDDMAAVRDMLTVVLEPFGHHLEFATDGQAGLDLFKSSRFDLVLCDIDMKPMDGITALKHLKAVDPDVLVVIMTSFTSTETAIQALKHGAFDYLAKPYKIDELLSALRRGSEALIKREAQAARGQASGGPRPPAEPVAEILLKGTDPKTKRLVAHLQKLASSATPVIFNGENGAGHEEAARALHAMSANSSGPLVVVDCRRLSEAELRAGLLGTEESFFSQATGGSLALINPQAIPLDVQDGLIKALRRASGTYRLICTTDEDLDALSQDGRFSEELFYRISVLPVALPALRERIADLPELVKALTLAGSSPHFDVQKVDFSPAALAALAAYAWPGNYLELKQVVLQAVAATDSRVIDVEGLPARFQKEEECVSLAAYLATQEQQYLAKVLRRFDGDVERAAQALGVPASRFGPAPA